MATNYAGGFNIDANPVKPKKPVLGAIAPTGVPPVTTQPVGAPVAKEGPGMGYTTASKPAASGLTTYSPPVTRFDPATQGGQTYAGPLTAANVPGMGSSVTPYTGPGSTMTAANVPGYQPNAAAPGTFNASTNLIASQITPTVDPRLAATQGQVNSAASNLATGPDRTAIARQAFADFLQQSGTQFGQQQRAITQAAAATGRLGSGMYGSDLTDLATSTDRARAQEANQLSQELANGTISDRYNTLGALQGLEGQQFGQGQANDAALRGERAYQYGLSQDAVQNQLAQAGLDNQQIAQLMQLGYQNNPAALYLGASGDVQQGANASGQGVNDLLYQWLLNKAGSKAGG